MNNNLKTVLLALGTSVATLGAYKTIFEKKEVFFNEAASKAGSMMNFANLPGSPTGDFVSAAGVSAPSVVHIKAKSKRQMSQQRSIFDLFGMDDDFFGGPRSQEQESSGSGVIITEDGYIVTNNHVVEGSSELEVITYNKKIYEATIIGADPSTDIAVIKIEEKKLPAITFSNSDDVKVGEWVLAVGNPFNLENTVTAGIVSAIGRNIDILSNRGRNTPLKESPIESFIQTDAAVNPGNSGGALVNLTGNLIGINTAIASPNGAYAGYSFAVPSSIVKKVSGDLIKYGNVQRGFIGIVPEGLDSKKAKEYDLNTDQGVYVKEIPSDGAAGAAGIKQGDVITKIDGVETKSEPKFRELIGRKRPGDKVILTVNRNGNIKDYTVTLKNNKGGESIIKKEADDDAALGKMGIKIEELSEKEKEKLGLKNGVRLGDVDANGLLGTQTNFEAGFIITRIDQLKVNSSKDIKTAIASAQKEGYDYITICGIYAERPNRTYCESVPFR